MGLDVNDVLLGRARAEIERWTPAYRAAFEDDQAERAANETGQAEREKLDIGSDVEIAGRVCADLRHLHNNNVVFSEGAIWRFVGTHWEAIPDNELRLHAHRYDGAEFRTPAGENAAVKLSKGRVDSVLQ